MNWTIVNQNLVAKSIGELSYEEILKPEFIGSGEYELTVNEDLVYSFKGWRGIWDHLRIDSKTLKRNSEIVTSAAQFFIDVQVKLEMTDIVLGNFLEEMHNSLYSDLALLERQKEISADQMTKLSGEEIQTYLNGHPKILLSKGRIGWGESELQKYAPEKQAPIQFLWVAVKKGLMKTSYARNFKSAEELLLESFSSEELEKFKMNIAQKNISFNDFDYLPVHEWQWNRFVKIQFQAQIASGDLVEIGTGGDFYLPQISIRTFSNHSRPEKLDIKLPLTILNTSAIRGIPARYIDVGHELSDYLEKVIKEDSLLSAFKTDLLKEKAGMSFEHPEFNKIKGAPYRYKEYLGAIWRESGASKKQNAEEKVIITGSLFHQDLERRSLIGAYIKGSGLSTTEWLTKYFEVVIIPLYHLQAKYGVGLVSHGQNIVLKLKNFAPENVILKDFQGDLRLAENSVLLGRADFKEIADKLDKLPPHYLIHDLLTGHLVTVLRFVSEALFESEGFKEIDFYRILGEVLQKYEAEHSVPEALSFLQEKVHRVLVNKVRFQIGYADSDQRPKPLVGTDLVNPIYKGLENGRNKNE